MIDRMIRVARLDRTVFGEVEQDPTATSQAAIVVAIVAVAQAIGNLGTPNVTVGTIIWGFIGAFIGWVIWSYLTYFIGTAVFHADATPQEMLRCLGFAYAPNVLAVFGLIPCLGWIAALAGAILALVAGFLAAKEALDLETGPTLITIVLSWLIMFVVIFGIGVVVGGAAVLTGAVAP